jgi:hypothetical protein
MPGAARLAAKSAVDSTVLEPKFSSALIGEALFQDRSEDIVGRAIPGCAGGQGFSHGRRAPPPFPLVEFISADVVDRNFETSRCRQPIDIAQQRIKDAMLGWFAWHWVCWPTPFHVHAQKGGCAPARAACQTLSAGTR